MPFTTRNIRRVYWDSASPNVYKIRWREIGSSNWVEYPNELTVPEAVFGVDIANEPLPNTMAYIAILQVGKSYEVQVRRKCGSSSFSEWTSSENFDTYLTCPDLESFSTVSTTSNVNEVTIEWGYDAYGSQTYPIINLMYKLTTSGIWTTIPYTPRDGNYMVLTLPGPGNWQFKITSQCKSTDAVEESDTIGVTVSGSYPPPTNASARRLYTGARISFDSPVSPLTPVISYDYRIDSGSWINIGLATNFTINSLPVLPPTSYTVDIRANYSGGTSANLSITFTTLTEVTVFDILGTNAQSPWSNSPTVDYAVMDNSYPAVSFGVHFLATGLSPDTIYSFSSGNNILGKTDDPLNYARPLTNLSWPISTSIIEGVFGLDTNGVFTFTGTIKTNGSGNIDLSLAKVYAN